MPNPIALVPHILYVMQSCAQITRKLHQMALFIPSALSPPWWGCAFPCEVAPNPLNWCWSSGSFPISALYFAKRSDEFMSTRTSLSVWHGKGLAEQRKATGSKNRNRWIEPDNLRLLHERILHLSLQHLNISEHLSLSHQLKLGWWIGDETENCASTAVFAISLGDFARTHPLSLVS